MTPRHSNLGEVKVHWNFSKKKERQSNLHCIIIITKILNTSKETQKCKSEYLYFFTFCDRNIYAVLPNYSAIPAQYSAVLKPVSICFLKIFSGMVIFKL